MTTTSTGTGAWSELASRLSGSLHLAVPPIFLSFSAERPREIDGFSRPMSEPAADGRRGRVPASCVFWIEAATDAAAFSTVAEDHGNCSVGLFTHGFSDLNTGNDDVAALLESGWVTPEMVPGIPSVTSRPAAISYGRLDSVPDGISPDVVLLRVNGRQMMVLSDAIPGLSIEGKPQCHIVAIAKEQRRPAASVGCALSRSRTGMRPEEMTCALPGEHLEEIVGSLEQTAEIDSVVARYAAADARRFSP